MTATNVVYLDEDRTTSDSERAARLWTDMEESIGRWEYLAQGATHKGRLDPRGTVAAVYAYGAHSMRFIKRQSVGALLNRASEEAVCEQMLQGLEKFQAECQSAVQTGSVKPGVSRAITGCMNAVINMRLSAACSVAPEG